MTLSSHTTCRPTAAAAAARRYTSLTNNHASVTVFIVLWPWPFTFWTQSQCIQRLCYGV